MLFDNSFIAFSLEEKLRNAYINECCVLENKMGAPGSPHRADIGVIKADVIHGHVIRGTQFGAAKLVAQVECCSRLFEQVTVVAGQNWHKVLDVLPAWCGVLTVTVDDDGDARWVKLRAPGASPHVDLSLAASMMWKGYLAERLCQIEGRMPPPSSERSELAERLLHLRGPDGVRQELMTFLCWRRTAPPLTLSWCEVH